MQAIGEQGVFCEVDQLLQTDADQSHAQLAEVLQGAFRCLCDVKDAGSDQYFRLNDEKASIGRCPSIMSSSALFVSS